MFKTQQLYQNDQKWKNLQLGNSRETIGAWGGLLTSMTMMLNGLGYNEAPDTVSEKLKNQDGFLKAVPGPSDLAFIWPNCVYLGMTRCENAAAPIEKIDKAVAAGKPVILQVDAREQTGIKTHFVLVKRREGDDYVLYDPYRSSGGTPDRQVLLAARYNGNGAKLESAISAVLWFDRLSAEDPSPAPRLRVPANKFLLFVTANNLILRDRESRKSFPRKRMVKGTELICLEPRATAEGRLKATGPEAEGQWIRVQEPDGEQGFVSVSFVTSDLWDLVPPPHDVPTPLKKWCLKKNVSIQNPRLESKSNGKPADKSVKSFSTLAQYTVVDVLKLEDTIAGWRGIMYKETYYDSGEKDWVESCVRGWVREAELDDYREDPREEFRRPVVIMENATRSTTDAAQYMVLAEDDEEEKKKKAAEVYNPAKIRHNLCGPFCVASIVGKDIDTLLGEWRETEKKEYKALYDRMVGRADKPLERDHIDRLLTLFIDPLYPKEKKWTRYIEDRIYLADEDDPRRASKALQKKLKDHYFLTHLKIDLNTGDLVPAYAREERNHWIVLDRITRDGSRVELYNPFPNRREEYSFGEFYQSIGSELNAGWWIERDVNPMFARLKKAASSGQADSSPWPTEEASQPPEFKVAIDNQTANETDAEQYLYIRGEGNKAKNNLCGEFSVSFILGQSLDNTLGRWQEGLKKEHRQPGIWELATLLQAYGFSRRKYIRPQKDPEKGKYYVAPNVELAISSNQHFKSFSIDTVLEYWKGVQPDLYNSILGGNRDEPTGPEDLITILKAYGYRKGEDYSYYRPGSKEVFGYAPGRDAEVIGKTHFLLAGVNIHRRTGNLQPSGIAHWIVVTKVTPRGNLRGGNGGWVELYNPFTNAREEYSYREFMNAFRGMSEGTTLWVKKDVVPVFTRQIPAPPKEKAPKKGGKVNKKDQSNQESGKNGKGKKGKGNKGARFQEIDEKPLIDVNRLVCERLDVEAIPWEIGKWIRDTARRDRFFAEELTDALVECGILSVPPEEEGKDKKRRIAVLTDPGFSDRLQLAVKKSTDFPAPSSQDPAVKVARVIAPLFAAKAIEEIKEIQKDTPVHAYQPLREFRAWAFGHAFKLSDPRDDKVPQAKILVDKIKKRLKSLPVTAKDQVDDPPMTVCSTVLTRFTSDALEKEVEKIFQDPEVIDHIRQCWDLKRGQQPEQQDEIEIDKWIWDLKSGEKLKHVDRSEIKKWIREWVHGLAFEPRKNVYPVYRVRRWGDPVMIKVGFGDSKLQAIWGVSSNFQAVGLYNTATEFGAVKNYLIIPPEDVLKLEALQIEDEYMSKDKDWLKQKMNWLCQHEGRIYMFGERADFKGKIHWRRPEGIRWGTIALGGNLVQVTGVEHFPRLKLPGENVARQDGVWMARLKGFEPKDWDRPLEDLLAEGLVHRCYCVYSGNDIGDSPQGIVYSPFWSPAYWEFMPKPKGKPAPTALWIPLDYLENPPQA